MNLASFFSGFIEWGPKILLAVLVFGIIIFVHELGHFLTAKWSKIKVNEFAMGMGPTLWKRQKGETVYALRAFPIGGFCAMEGEDEDSPDKNSFGNAPLYKRMIVTIAGSTMNLLLGLIILLIISSQILVGTTMISKFEDSAVTNQWLQAGDTIIGINGHRVRTSNDLDYELTRDRDGIMDIEVMRKTADGASEKVLLRNVTFQMESPPEAQGLLIIKRDFWVSGSQPTFTSAIKNSFDMMFSIVKQVWGSLIDLVTGRYKISHMSGPVGVTSAIGKAAAFGWKSVMMLVAFITINLGVFNMLPLPALDGGRFLFLLLEAVRRKPIKPEYEGMVHTVGFLLLIGLMIVVTVSDVSKWSLYFK